MEENEKKKVMGKIKKLMALGMKHEETPEGQSALEKARVLMGKYDIRFLDVEDDGSVLDNNLDVAEMPWNKYRNDFEMYLANMIAKTFDCDYLTWNKGSKFAAHKMVGTKTDLELATWLFKFTRLQCYRLAEGQPYKGAALRTYFHGMITALKPRIDSTFSTVKSEKMADVDCTAMVLVKNDAVTKRTKELFPDLKTHRKPRGLKPGTGGAWSSGKADGEKVRVNLQVGNNSNSKLGE